MQKVNACFKEELTAEKMEKRMNDYFALQVHPILKFAPLELKNVCINIGARTAESDVTAIFPTWESSGCRKAMRRISGILAFIQVRRSRALYVFLPG